MKKYFHQTKIVYFKSFTTQQSRKRVFQNILIPFLCGILIYISKIKNLDFLIYFQTFYMPLAVCGVIRSYLQMIVQEKKDRQKENQLIMGLNNCSYYTGWIASCITWTVICSSVYIFMVVTYTFIFVSYFGLEQYLIFYLQYILFGYAIIGQMLFLSSFFEESRKATDVYGFLYILIIYLYYFTNEQLQTYTIICLGLFPQNLIVYFWWYKFNQVYISINYLQTLLIFFCQGSIGIILYLYFDQVLPNQYGTHKHPLFFIYYFCKKQNRIELIEDDLELQQRNNIQSELLNQQNINQEQPCVKIKGLTKQYNGKSVVDKLTIDLYQDQIFCLLGHNGAGKSSTINMICGLIEKDNGIIEINGYDIEKNIDNIRQLLGFCSQKDILYSDITVYEHLTYYAEIKMIPKSQITQHVEKTLQICQLSQDRLKPSKYLSGGGKRKLCLAIALIGDAQLLLLDEPTTGLDPLSRSQLWNILREIKKDRCIILTTHFLDEVQELADNVGIIKEGKLIVQGTVSQIKNQFSVGYNIQIECLNGNQSKEVLDLIEPTLQLLCQQDIKCIQQNRLIKFNIPKISNNKIVSILEFLESLNNINISLEMTTLEDAYIKIHYDYSDSNSSVQELININNNNLQTLFDQNPQFQYSKQIKGLFIRRYQIAKQNIWEYILFYTIWIMLIQFYSFTKTTYAEILFFYSIMKLLFTTQQIYYPVSEKQNKIKKSLIIHGTKIQSYWISYILFDIIIVIIEQLILTILILINEFLIHKQDVEQARWLFLDFWQLLFIISSNILFSLFCITQSYFISYFCKTAQFTTIQLPIIILFFNVTIFIFEKVLFNDSNFKLLFMLFTPISILVENYSYIQAYNSDFTYIYYFLLDIIICLSYFLTTTILDYQDNKLPQKSYITNENISVKEITQQFKTSNKKILDKVNFNVESKQIFGLLGPNGAGKTTTFDILARNTKPIKGEIYIKNENTHTGYVPSFSPLYEDLTYKQHLQLYGKIKGQTQQSINCFIRIYTQLMNINSIIDKKVKYLSGGERRKVQLGIALIGGSSNLIMDEPTSGIDPVSRDLFQSLMIKHCEIVSSSMIVTTHSMTEAQKICEVLGILINGKLQFQGTMNQLRQIYDNRIQVSFKIQSTEYIQQLQELINENLTKQYQQIYEQRINYLTYLIDLKQIKLSNLYKFCQSKNIQNIIEEFQIQFATLEQIFRHFALQQQQINNQDIDLDIQVLNQQRNLNILSYCCCQI